MTFEVDWQKYIEQIKIYIKNDKELRIWAIVGIILAIGGGSYYGYRWMNQRWAQKAQIAFAESHDVYQQALMTQFNDKVPNETKKELWDHAEIDFKQAYAHNNHSSFAPFFKAFRGQTLNFQGAREEALTEMREALDKMGSSNYYRGLYEINLAFMLLDGDQDDKDQGVKKLSILGDDEKNSFQDMALYYLGLYFNVSGDPERAREYWKKIKQVPASAVIYKKAESPWAQLAKMKLMELEQEKE